MHRGAALFFLLPLMACSTSDGGSAKTALDAGIKDTAPSNEVEAQPDPETLGGSDEGFLNNEETTDSASVTAEGDAEVLAPPSPLDEVVTITGNITWHVDFSAEVEAKGHDDCTFTMTYEGHEDRTTPWICVECSQVFRATAEVVSGDESCLAKISAFPPPEHQWFGKAGDDWYWSPQVGYPLKRQGVGGDDGGKWILSGVSEGTVGLGLTYTLNSSGDLTFGGDIADPLFGMTPPESYACGWPKSHLPPYDGPYELKIGERIPDGVFIDQCGEPMRLDDMMGNYVVFDISALDCGPCKEASSLIGGFLATMESHGVNVEVISMMVPSIYQPEGMVTLESVQQWVEEFQLKGPMLVDRGYMKVVGGAYFGTGIGFPTTILIAPDLKVFNAHNGFSGWSETEQAILSHAGSNPD